MADFTSALGFDPSSNWSVFLLCAIFTFAVVTALWVVGLAQGNHSMMDGWYGFAFVAPALIAYVTVGAQSVTAALLLFMVMLHGGRLGFYLAARWRRYVPNVRRRPALSRLRERPVSRLLVEELLQGDGAAGRRHRADRLPSGIRHPEQAVSADGGIGACWPWSGSSCSSSGFYFETVADAQLQSFLALDQRPRYLNTGVWTVHPPSQLLRQHPCLVGDLAGCSGGQPRLLVDGGRSGGQHHHVDLGPRVGVPGQLHGLAPGVPRVDGPHPTFPTDSAVRQGHHPQSDSARGAAVTEGHRKCLRPMTPSWSGPGITA